MLEPLTARRLEITLATAQSTGRLPSVAGGVVRDAGRDRWATFPDIVADDKFARLHFDRAERRLLEDSEFRVHLPVGIVELVRVRSRWITGGRG